MSKPHKGSTPMIWVESKEGNHYLCPMGALAEPREATEEELKSACVDESRRPYGD